MELSYSYRGKKTLLANQFYGSSLNSDGTVSFGERIWSDGNSKVHQFKIEATDLLPTAKDLLRQLSKISGVEYGIYLSVRGGSVQYL